MLKAGTGGRPALIYVGKSVELKTRRTVLPAPGVGLMPTWGITAEKLRLDLAWRRILPSPFAHGGLPLAGVDGILPASMRKE